STSRWTRVIRSRGFGADDTSSSLRRRRRRRVAVPVVVRDLLADLRQPPLHPRQLLADAGDVGVRRKIEHVQAPALQLLEPAGQLPVRAAGVGDEVEVALALNQRLDRLADRALELLHELEPPPLILRHVHKATGTGTSLQPDSSSESPRLRP